MNVIKFIDGKMVTSDLSEAELGLTRKLPQAGKTNLFNPPKNRAYWLNLGLRIIDRDHKSENFI